MKKIIYSIFLFSFITLTFSCTADKNSLSLMKVTEQGSSKLSDSALIKILKNETGKDIEITYSISQQFAFEQLNDGKVDMIVAPNNIAKKIASLDFRTIVPLLPRVLMVLTNKKTETENLKELLENNTVIFEEMSKTDSLFFDNLYYNFDIKKEKIKTKNILDLNLENKSDSIFVYVGLTHMHNLFIKKLVDYNWFMFSLDNIQNYGMGSKLEGVAMIYPSTYPFIIPMSIYKGKPEKPIFTIAIKDMLICRNDLDDDIVYNIARTIIEKKPQLVLLNNAYTLLDFDKDQQLLSFPLHEGTKNYIERNKPSIWMQYINMAWPILSILVIFIGAFTSFNRNLKKKKKESIENYYTSLLKIRKKSFLINSRTNIEDLLDELKVLKSDAIKALANNSFDSSESFNIFLALYSEIKNDLIDDLNKK